MRNRQRAALAAMLCLTFTVLGARAGSDCEGPELGDRVREMAASASLEGLTEPQRKLVLYIADRIIQTGSIAFTDEELMDATGVTEAEFQAMDEKLLQSAVVAELTRRNFNVGALAGAGNCSRFSACSVDRDLSGASGEELARYEAERAEDGTAFAGKRAPAFSLPATDGSTVSLSDYAGRKVVLIALSGHCMHSLQTLHLLPDLATEFAPQGVVILPVYVNSGTAQDVKSWTSALDLETPLLVDPEKALSESYGFRMVPTAFFIDEQGIITRKLVGQKSIGELRTALTELVGSQEVARAD